MKAPSRGGILVCEECGEGVVLDGPLSVWCSDGAPFGYACAEGAARVSRSDPYPRVGTTRGTLEASNRGLEVANAEDR